MKIIEGMKQIKDLQRKAEDLRKKIAACSADLDVETPQYEDQKTKVSGWLQAHHDIMKEIMRLRSQIQWTNMATMVSIDLGGFVVVKPISEWINRRRDLANLEREAWSKLTDRNLKEGIIKQSNGETREVKLRRYYDPVERDQKVDLYMSEPLMIDARLEVVNAVTELIPAPWQENL